MALSKSEAAKLNTAKSIEVSKLLMLQRVESYMLNPKLCLQCGSIIPYEKRNNKCCNSTCGALYSNARKDFSKISTGPIPKEYRHLSRDLIPKKISNACRNCGIKKVGLKDFCSRDCQRELQFKDNIAKWKSGEKIGCKIIKRYLIATDGYKCSECGITDWNGKSLMLDLEHKDGNSDNNLEENLCLLCPNCHSQTDTYKAKNKGNGRHYRRVRYADGKSF